MSNGKNKYPAWTTLNIPIGQKGEFYLYSSTTTKDTIGIDLPYLGNNIERYSENLLLNEPQPQGSLNWVELKDLETKVTIPDIISQQGVDPGKVYTRLAIQLQTGMQLPIAAYKSYFYVQDIWGNSQTITNIDAAWISFAIGVFIGDNNSGYKLKQVRTTQLADNIDASDIFDIFTLIGAIDNLSAGEHTIKIAVKRRNQASWMTTLHNSDPTKPSLILHIGKPRPNSTNYSNFMAQSFLRADLFVISE